MKYLAVILALIIGTPSIAYAGILDGKGLICGKGVSKNNFLFFEGKVGSFKVHIIGTTLLPPEVVSRPRSFDHPYVVYEKLVKWDKFTIDRKTLILAYDSLNPFTNDGTRMKWSQQCRLTNKQGIEREIDREVKAREASMKKNKL